MIGIKISYLILSIKNFCRCMLYIVNASVHRNYLKKSFRRQFCPDGISDKTSFWPNLSLLSKRYKGLENVCFILGCVDNACV